MEENEKRSEHGAKVKAGKLLNQFLREIAQEMTEVIKDPETGDDRMATKAEALVRNMWKMALGYTEQRVVGKDLVDTKYAPDKGMMARVFERLEGKVPMTTASGKQGVTASKRLYAENIKRMNEIATANIDKQT